MNDNLLRPVDDGLPMRESREYARDKLRIIRGYTDRLITSMREKHWRAYFYIDLEAGPGKNLFPVNEEVMVGSPLIGLDARFPFTHYRFIELDQVNCDALKERVAASDLCNRVKVWHGDCNKLVNEIVNEIRVIDMPPATNQNWHSLNMAILDPEGLELHWDTVEKLGQMNKMDMIFTFWTSGITRNASALIASGRTEKIDLMFGTDEWQRVYGPVAQSNSTEKRRVLIDFYISRLKELDYLIGNERVFLNSRNVQVYTMIGACKHPLGIKFWNDVIRGLPQSRLPGF